MYFWNNNLLQEKSHKAWENYTASNNLIITNGFVRLTVLVKEEISIFSKFNPPDTDTLLIWTISMPPPPTPPLQCPYWQGFTILFFLQISLY